MQKKDFITLLDHSADQIRFILDRSIQYKKARQGLSKGALDADLTLKDKVIALLFTKPSTRTRVSFDVGIRQMGGQPLILSGAEMQLGRGETIADTARILSRYVDAVMIRTTNHEDVLEFAEHASIPVINGLTNKGHPCQIMADIMTFQEKKGSIQSKTIAWIGDFNNVCYSWMEAAALLEFTFHISVPSSLRPSEARLSDLSGKQANIHFFDDPYQAVSDADCVVTDTWVSMGDKDGDKKLPLLQPYQVTDDLMRHAKPDAIFMHCLPAHRGEEMTASVIDGPQSVVWDEAENRLHAQKGILQWVLS